MGLQKTDPPTPSRNPTPPTAKGPLPPPPHTHTPLRPRAHVWAQPSPNFKLKNKQCNVVDFSWNIFAFDINLGAKILVLWAKSNRYRQKVSLVLVLSVSRFFSSKCARYCSKCARKCASLKCQFFIVFLDVSGWVYFLKIWLFDFLKKKFWNSQNAPLFGFSRIARDSKINARERVKMRHFRAK